MSTKQTRYEAFNVKRTQSIETMIKPTSTLLITLLLCIYSFQLPCQCKNLPSLWSEGTVELKSYRLKAELELIESGKTFILEEWVSSTKQFRLDLIDSFSGVRRTLLSNKYTNERFFYEPFKCSLVQNFDGAFFPELADKFRSNFDLLVPTGIGSLWLQSSRVEAEYLKSTSLDTKLQVKTASSVLKNYTKYSIQPTGNYPFKLDFYFRYDEENLKSLALINVSKMSGSLAIVLMRIKLLDGETFTKSLEWSVDSYEGVFELPVGYGCQRSEFYDRSFAVPVNTFLPKYVPQVLQLDIVTIQPISLVDDNKSEKWRSHVVSARLIAGRLTLNSELSNDYLILETQDFVLKSSSQSQPVSSLGPNKRAVTLRRRKRIWDLGRDGLTTKEQEKRAKFFEIDEKTRQCSDFGESKLSDSASIELPIFPEENNKPSTGEEETGTTILSLNTELIETLFSSSQDYHLMKEGGSGTYPYLREAIYERRVERFQIKDNKGKVVWSGPASFVRSHSKQLKSDVMRQTSSSIYLYSKGSTQLRGRIHLEVVERRTISEAYLHRELEDIGAICFSQMLNLSGPSKEKNIFKEKEEQSSDPDAAGESLDFVLSYLVDSSEEVQKLSLNDGAEERIYQQFLQSIFSVSNNLLNMLQLTQVNVDFGPDMIKVSGKLVRVPTLLNYWQDYEQKFSQSKRNLLFTEENVVNQEACAEACLHYSCFMFSYCLGTKSCDILLSKPAESNEAQRTSIVMTFEPDLSCSVFKPILKPDKQPLSFISPVKLLQKLHQTILSSRSDDDKENVLKLKLEYNLDSSEEKEKQELSLSPIFVESGSFSEQDFNDLYGGLEENKNKNKNGEERGQIEEKYKTVFENRKYKDSLEISENFPIQLAQHSSFNDCKSLCADIDCRSFSHCKIESTCRVSQLHKTKLIMESSQEEDLCSIWSRDYLSKFKKLLNNEAASMKLLKVSKTLVVDSESDCAIDCMEESKFKCKSFYYCSSLSTPQEHDKQLDGDVLSEPKKFNCYLRKSHLSPQDKTWNRTSKLMPNIEAKRQCYLYSRSYLAEFDTFLGRSLSGVIVKLAEDGSEVVHGSGAESCALQCATLDGNCEAFQVCRSETSFEPSCSFLTKLMTNLEEPLEPDQLVEDEKCTTFVISKKSELYKVRDGNGESGEQVKVEDDFSLISNYSPSTSNESHWFVKLLFFLVGLTLGYLVTLAIKKKRASSTH